MKLGDKKRRNPFESNLGVVITVFQLTMVNYGRLLSLANYLVLKINQYGGLTMGLGNSRTPLYKWKGSDGQKFPGVP